MRSKMIYRALAFLAYRLGCRAAARAFERTRARALGRAWARVRPDLYYHLPPLPRRRR